MGQLDGRVAFITGAASGIGAACALRFAREGARVAGLDIGQPDPAAWKPVNDAAPAASFHVADVRDEDAVAAAVADATTELGSVDALVNAAGVAGGGPVHDVASDEWDRVIDINLKGTFIACKHVLRGMLAAGRGSIVNIASIEGIEGFEGGSSYNASKGGVVLLTRNLAMDYGRRGIRANALCPGFIETPLLDSLFVGELAEYRDRIAEITQLGRLGRAGEMASAALFLASDESSYMSGQSLIVDGGLTAGHRVGVSRLFGLG